MGHNGYTDLGTIIKLVRKNREGVIGYRMMNLEDGGQGTNLDNFLRFELSVKTSRSISYI